MFSSLQYFAFFASGGLLLSTSNKSNQKCLSAHFAISDNTPLRSVLVKFEAEPNLTNYKINHLFRYTRKPRETWGFIITQLHRQSIGKSDLFGQM